MKTIDPRFLLTKLRGLRLRVTDNGDGTATLVWDKFAAAIPDAGDSYYTYVDGNNVSVIAVTSGMSFSTTLTINDPSAAHTFQVKLYRYDEGEDGDLPVPGQETNVVTRTITGYTDVAAYIDSLESEGRIVSPAERIALYTDKTNGLAAGWYNKMYDRVLLGWAEAGANAVRQIGLSLIDYTAPASHSNPGYVDFAGGGYGTLWTTADAFSSAESIGNLIGVVGSSNTTGGKTDLGSADGSDLYNLAFGYGFAYADFGGFTTARAIVAAATQDEGFYLANRVSASTGRLRSYIASTLATAAANSSMSGGSLNALPLFIGGTNSNGSPAELSGRKYSQVASFDGLTNTEADDALIDAMALEIALGWRTA